MYNDSWMERLTDWWLDLTGYDDDSPLVLKGVIFIAWAGLVIPTSLAWFLVRLFVPRRHL